MITAVVDTNVIVRGAIAAHPQSASKDVLDAFFAGRFLLLLSPAALHEIEQVLAQDDIRAKHGWTDEQILRFCLALQVGSHFIEPSTPVPHSVARDVTDTKWLALALDGKADYLVTVDRRHLERLKTIGRTQIVRPPPSARR